MIGINILYFTPSNLFRLFHFLLIPLTFIVFLIISIVVAFRTKLKTIDSKRLALITAILLLLTAVVFILIAVTPDNNDYNDFSSKSEEYCIIVWVANFLVSGIALFLYIIAYNIYYAQNSKPRAPQYSFILASLLWLFFCPLRESYI